MSEYLYPVQTQPRFTTTEVMLTQHNGDEPQPTRRMLGAYGANQKLLDVFFTPDGKWNFSMPNFLPYAHSGKELDDRMSAIMRIPNKFSQMSLLAGHRYFNDHSNQHTANVALRAVQLLKLGGNSQEALDNAYIIGRTHDVGNMKGRKNHELHGVDMTEAIFPRLLEDESRWDVIKRGITYHNEDYYEDNGYDGRSFEERQEMMAETHPPEASAIAFADKIDIHPGRIGFNARNRKAINEHQHSGGNLASETVAVIGDSRSRSLEWHLRFRPFFNKDEAKKFGDLSLYRENGHYVMAAPPYLRENPDVEESGFSFQKSWQQLIKIYGPQKEGGVNRFRIIVDSAFHLLPGLKEFRMVYGNGLTGETITETFTPENTDDILADFAMMNRK